MKMEHKLIALFELTLDPLEQDEVKQWIEADPAHKKIYEDTVFVWKKSKHQTVYSKIGKEKAWEKLQTKINSIPDTSKEKASLISFNWRLISSIAASIALIAGIFLFLHKSQMPTQFATNKDLQKISLKDNSHITLFKNSKLSLASDFNKKSRTVTFNGNAYFDIARNPEKPFIIHTQGMKVEVLGTSFTIQQSKLFNTVFVHSGKVKATINNQAVTATAKQKIIRNQLTHTL